MPKARFEYKKDFVKKDGRKLHGGGPRDLQRKQQSQPIVEIDNSTVVNALKSQIDSLKDELKNSVSSGGGFTQEELEAEIRKSSEAIENKYKSEIEELKSRLKHTQLDNVKALEKQADNLKSLENKVSDMKAELSTINSEKTKLEEELLILKTTSSNKDDKINDLNDRIKEQKETIALLKQRPVTVIDGTGPVVDDDRPKLDDVFIDPIEAGAEDGLESHVAVKDISTKEKNSNRDKVDKLRSILGKGNIK